MAGDRDPLTEEEAQALADEAERGYKLSQIKPAQASAMQQLVLDRMVWNGRAWPMTTSEIHARFKAHAEREGTYVLSRSTIEDHLKAMLRKGLVRVVDEGTPRKWQSAKYEVYLVTFSDYDEHSVNSVWTTKPAADTECARLQAEHKKSRRGGNYDVEEFTLDTRWDEING